MNVLVTGATGFIAAALLRRMRTDGGYTVRAAVRREGAALPAGVERVRAELDAATDWRPALAGIDAVIHLAARVHVMRETARDPLAEFRRVNVEGTRQLARQAAAAGVRRFLFLSSIKVNGESGLFTESDPPRPQDAYGISKHEAETALREIAARPGMGVVILRPPLVYGPGVRANFRSLMRAIDLGIPLPLGAVENRRSMIGVDNLADVILTALAHPAAAGQTFLVSDGEDLSTSELIRRLARAMNRPARLMPVPVPVLRTGAALLGRRDAAARLLGSLQIDMTKARRQLAWTPPVSVDEGLRRVASSSRAQP